MQVAINELRLLRDYYKSNGKLLEARAIGQALARLHLTLPKAERARPAPLPSVPEIQPERYFGTLNNLTSK